MTESLQRPSSPAQGYADRPIVKEPVWTWEVPVYFFVGGIAGMAMVIAFVVELKANLARDALGSLVSGCIWIAFAGAAISPALLISDLGRPARFLNMLRRLNLRSPMSVGVWILVSFSAVVSVLWMALVGESLGLGWLASTTLESVRLTLLCLAAVLGSLLATYTGVLLGVSAIPAWNVQRRLIPAQFGFASLGGAASVLQLMGQGSTSLTSLLGLSILILVLLHVASLAAAAPRLSGPGWFVAAPVLMMVLPPIFLVFELASLAAGSFLVGGLMSRFVWIEKGRLSARASGAAI